MDDKIKNKFYRFKAIADEYFEGLEDEVLDYVVQLEKEVERLKNEKPR